LTLPDRGSPAPAIAAPSIAVVVPIYREAARLPALLAQLRSQPADEVILVDGGSDDGSQAILQQSGLTWIETAAGRARQMNAGAAQVTSDVILFLHADTEMTAAHLQAVRAAMVDARVVGGRFNLRLSGEQWVFRVIEWLINWRSRLTRISTGDQCIFIRRSLFEQLGGFPDLPLMEDVALSKQMKRVGRIACLKEPVVTSSRRWEQHGIARTVLLMWQLRLLYWLGVSPARLAARYRLAR